MKPQVLLRSLLIVLGLTLIVMAISIQTFPQWTSVPGGVLLLFGVAFKTILEIPGKLKEWVELLSKDKKKSEENTPPQHTAVTISTQHTRIGNEQDVRSIQSELYVEGNYYAGPAPAPKPRGYIPYQDVYIQRGKIETDVRKRLANNGVAAIVGVHAPGGVGKTELAKRAAADLRDDFDDVLWVELGAKSPNQVISDLAGQCDLHFVPATGYSQKVTELKSFLGQHKLLLVLDDVRSENAFALVDLVPPSPPCACLITSRLRHLNGLPTRATFELDRMTSEQAFSLLTELLGEEILLFERNAAKNLIERCCYNPLALDIAARRILEMKHLQKPISWFSRKLDICLNNLYVGDDIRLNLFAVFDISYASLSEADQRRFYSLAVFAPTGFSPEGAAAVWMDTSEETGAAISRLLQHSLIKPAPGKQERYRLHDLLDGYASEKLRNSGGEIEVRQLMCAWVINTFEQPNTILLDDLATNKDILNNLVDAISWACDQKNGDLIARLTTLSLSWLMAIQKQLNTKHDLLASWQKWLEMALEFGIDDNDLKASTYQALGNICNSRNDQNNAIKNYYSSIEIFQLTKDLEGEANILKTIGDLFRYRQENEEALTLYQKALEIFEETRDRYEEANVLKAMGDLCRYRQENEEALTYYQKALEIMKMTDDRQEEPNVLKDIGDILNQLGKQDDALTYYNESLELFRSAGSKLGEANIMKTIGEVQEARSNWNMALKSYDDALNIYRLVGDKLNEANMYIAKGKILFSDDKRGANELLAKAIFIYWQTGNTYSVPTQIGSFGWHLLRLGDVENARIYLSQAADLFDQIGLPDYAEQHRNVIKTK